MALSCPHCQHRMSVKDAKPGQYKPKCSKCGERFAVTIFADRDAIITKLAPAELAATIAPGVTVPVAAQRRAAAPAATLPLPSKSTVETVSASPQSKAFDETTPPPAKVVEHTIAHDRVSSTQRSTDEATGAWSIAHEETAPSSSFDATTPSALSDPTRHDTTHAAARSMDMPQTIDGYRIQKELGHGAMGAVYLARQLSLDRDVALKTIQSRWASDPAFIARFTREAYAAAQLTHHNVVQIYDMGQDQDVHYFSMEYVRGTTLDEIVQQHGKLDVNVAVGYVLQAARGLQFAHNQGMIHRDVKPANLMLNEQGIVKVADLGLVKTLASSEDSAADGNVAGSKHQDALANARSDQTQLNIAMGTPAFMSPEQSENAAGVDHRADIYSLGCTLYVLLTGRPPFAGASVMEVITKHRTEPIVRPDAVVKRVPGELSEIVLRMVAKTPAERYAHLGEVISSLEGFLGIQSGQTFSPSEEHADALEHCHGQFQSAPAGRIRKLLALSFVALCVVAILVLLPMSLPLAGGALGLLLITVATYFCVSGIKERTYLFRKVRALVFSAKWTDWLTYAGSVILVVVLLYVIGWLWYWLAFAGIAVGMALTYSFVVDRKLNRQRREPLEKTRELLRTLRLRGLDEPTLQQFVAQYSGAHWEEFHEALFGFEAKLAAREHLLRSEQGRKRRRFRAWREPIIRWIDAHLLAQREARDRQHLQQVEEKSLEAQGVDLLSARRQAQRVADALIDEAAEVRSTTIHPATVVTHPEVAAQLKRQRVKTMLAEARSGKYEAHRSRHLRTAASPLAFLLGPKMRFLLGCMLLAGCALWARQNHLFSGEHLKDVTSAVVTSVERRDTGSLEHAAQRTAGNSYQPLNIPVVGPLVSGFNAGLAGLMLIALAFFRGWKMSIFALPAAALMVLGSAMPLPNFGSSMGSPLLSSVGGIGLGLAGLVFGRTKIE